MKTSHRIFLRRDGKRGHEPVLVVLDWDNVSQLEMDLMASFYILHRAAQDLKGFDHTLPESIEYRAMDFVHNEPLITMPEAPAPWKTDKPSKAVKDFKEALKGLTPEEVRALLAD